MLLTLKATAIAVATSAVLAGGAVFFVTRSYTAVSCELQGVQAQPDPSTETMRRFLSPAPSHEEFHHF